MRSPYRAGVITAAALLLCTACPAPQPQPPVIAGRAEVFITQGIQVVDAASGQLCEAQLRYDLLLNGSTSLDIWSSVKVQGTLPLCDYRAWAGLAGWVNCGKGKPLPTAPPSFWCGTSDVGVANLTVSHIVMTFTQSPDQGFLALHFEGWWGGVKTVRDGYSDQILCVPGRCLFQQPSPN